MNIIKKIINEQLGDKVFFGRKLLRKGPAAAAVLSREENHSVSAAGREKAGWVSPSYTQSQSVWVDPIVAARNKCIAVIPNAPEVEAYKVLRRKILNLTKEHGWNTVMVTSALPGEGKTLTAINLSLTFAREFDQTVLLVDCDLRKQSIHEMLGIKSDRGLIDYLLSDTPINDVMIWPKIEKFTLISGGKTIQDSAELLGSQRMKELFSDMKTRYPDRCVFFDVPPLLSGADALTFATLADCVLVVVQAERTPLDDVRRALEMVPEGKLLGLVVNRQKSGLNQYPYSV